MNLAEGLEKYISGVNNLLFEDLTTKDQLRMRLLDDISEVSNQGFSGLALLKNFEYRFQETIENFYPDRAWWEVTSCNIFMDLLENQDPFLTVDHIIKGITEEDVEEDVDLSKVEGPSMTKVISDNHHELDNSTSKEDLLFKLKNLFDDYSIDTPASRRLIDNVAKSRTFISALQTIYNSYLAGTGNKVLKDSLEEE